MPNALNVCVIDDDDIYQFTIVKSLEPIKSVKNITVFSDGEEAINFLSDNLSEENSLPDVILLDINMPIMDGFQFMEEYVKIKSKIGKRITIYMVSSSVDPVDIERVKNISDISEYILKPLMPNDLKFLIEKLNEN
ncbi:response regulator [Roseivirga echinicomitans]|uniref:Transcriptional regulator n=1 Tax=Roseivirga echinicomitans TaxID=296218 RepID=A0A150X1U1_9BACT|nr:response regulator [Roseivirga echinicomitans]KYG72691.1 transcriptional regulator [Roseivirga echinicomitans]